MTETRFKSDASEAVHSAASGLHRAGLTGKNGMD
ncbi:transcriptional regulator, partial [Ralstonia pseudosolanacearum]